MLGYAVGTLIIGIVIPAANINLVQSLLVAYNQLWDSFGLSWAGNIIALLIMVGVIGQVSALVNGPSTGLMSVAQSGYLPRKLQNVNAKGVNKSILIISGVFVSVLTLILLVLPTVESAYQIMSQLATIIYLIMVLFIYGAFIRLRHTAPNKVRGYRVPGGKVGAFIVCFLGIFGALAALLLSFLLLGTAVFVALPLVVYALRRPSWRNPDAHFYPFDWQIEGRKPGGVSKWAPGYEPTEEQVDAAETDAICKHGQGKC